MQKQLEETNGIPEAIGLAYDRFVNLQKSIHPCFIFQRFPILLTDPDDFFERKASGPPSMLPHGLINPLIIFVGYTRFEVNDIVG